MPGVDANYRYIAAAQEVNARIAHRQQALSLYVTLVVSLLAALVALKPGAGGTALPVEWLVLGFPVASTCLAFLNYKTERALSNLRAFLSALERIDDGHVKLPSYNTDPRWALEANRARRFHDYASAVLVGASNLVAVAAFVNIYPSRAVGTSPAIWLTAVVAVLCMIALLWIPRLSYRPDQA
ncbi:hypothetical protein VVD49_04370 [Uliginosibacterium sp. H3]|uniref:SMODS and SLOG-associating 2TM effector domain-containing protein n=1 Tax=Uliginosibacterium silvisoli TaxID=3114758 RepID=A0ABU6K1L1_9RHOO|nr:hypothetical protein [Uliginosibacterium sp. H3]